MKLIFKVVVIQLKSFNSLLLLVSLLLAQFWRDFRFCGRLYCLRQPLAVITVATRSPLIQVHHRNSHYRPHTLHRSHRRRCAEDRQLAGDYRLPESCHPFALSSHVQRLAASDVVHQLSCAVGLHGLSLGRLHRTRRNTNQQAASAPDLSDCSPRDPASS